MGVTVAGNSAHEMKSAKVEKKAPVKKVLAEIRIEPAGNGVTINTRHKQDGKPSYYDEGIKQAEPMVFTSADEALDHIREHLEAHLGKADKKEK